MIMKPAKYFIHHSTPQGSWYTYHDTIAEAIEKAKGKQSHTTHVAIYGSDGYDCDCENGSYFVCNDGLTDEERELIEEALRG